MTTKRKLIFIVGVLMMAFGIGCLSFLAVRHFRARKDNADINDIAFHESTEAPAATSAATAPESSTAEQITTEPVTTAAPETETKEPYVSPIDFDALWKVNEDIYAWLEIEDTDISYPILQHPTDNRYYLNHTVERRSGFPGSIFTYNVNAKDFTDFNTVIYGHRMDNGMMFSNLKFYRDASYLDEHRTIRIYLPDRELVYTVFAAVVYDDRLITSYYRKDDPYSSQAYLDSIYGNRDMNSIILAEPPVTTQDRIITLSTCIKWQKQNRYLIVAVLTDEIT